jgi:CBS domain-containing protein
VSQLSLAEKKVEELMTSPPVCISKDSPVGKALSLMLDHDFSHLIAVDGKRVAGVVSMWDLVDVLGSSRFRNVPVSRIHVSAVMSEPAVTIQADDKVEDAKRIMLERDFSCLPVMRGDNLVGIITETDIVKMLKDSSAVRDLMRSSYPKVMPIDRIVHARAIMIENGVRVIPVVEEGRLVGIVTERALAKAFYHLRDESRVSHIEEAVRRVIVEDVMEESPEVLREDQSIEEAAALFYKARIPALPVIEGDLVKGMLERKSLLLRV